MSVQLQALTDEVFEAAAALDLVVPPGMRTDPAFAAADESETRVAMVQAFTENPDAHVGEGQGGGLTIVGVQGQGAWLAFEALIRADAAERGWTAAMTARLITLDRWRAANTSHRFYLAHQGDRAVARVGLFQHRTTAYLHALFTHPEFRRRGAGAFLTQALDAEARSVGCDRLALQCTRDSVLPAYFERLGFRRVGERQIWTKSE